MINSSTAQARNIPLTIRIRGVLFNSLENSYDGIAIGKLLQPTSYPYGEITSQLGSYLNGVSTFAENNVFSRNSFV